MSQNIIWIGVGISLVVGIASSFFLFWRTTNYTRDIRDTIMSSSKCVILYGNDYINRTSNSRSLLVMDKLEIKTLADLFQVKSINNSIFFRKGGICECDGETRFMFYDDTGKCTITIVHCHGEFVRCGFHDNSNLELTEASKHEVLEYLSSRLNYHHHDLFNAVSEGLVHVIQEVIDNGVDINVTNSFGQTPLHLAAYFGHMEEVQFLLSKSANPNVVSVNGRTPLDMALLELLERHRDYSKAVERKAQIANLLRKHGGKTGLELDAEKPLPQSSLSSP